MWLRSITTNVSARQGIACCNINIARAMSNGPGAMGLELAGQPVAVKQSRHSREGLSRAAMCALALSGLLGS